MERNSGKRVVVVWNPPLRRRAWVLFTPKLCRGEQAIGGTTSRQFPVYWTIIFSCWYIPLRATRYISLSKQHLLACTHTCVQQCVKKTDVIDFFLFFFFFFLSFDDWVTSVTQETHTHTHNRVFSRSSNSTSRRRTVLRRWSIDNPRQQQQQRTRDTEIMIVLISSRRVCVSFSFFLILFCCCCCLPFFCIYLMVICVFIIFFWPCGSPSAFSLTPFLALTKMSSWVWGIYLVFFSLLLYTAWLHAKQHPPLFFRVKCLCVTEWASECLFRVLLGYTTPSPHHQL